MTINFLDRTVDQFGFLIYSTGRHPHYVLQKHEPRGAVA